MSLTNAEVFREVLSLDTHDEHPLEYHRAYQQYLKRFEGRIEGEATSLCTPRTMPGHPFAICAGFITQIGGTVSEFYVQCKDVLQHGDTMESRRFFIKALLATSEYEAFFWLMKNEVKCRK
jgi:hypothetical protein